MIDTAPAAGVAQSPFGRRRYTLYLAYGGNTMSLSMYQASIPAFIRGLEVLDTLVDKARAFAEENKIAPDVLINARLAPDMFPFASQIQRASDTSKLAAERLTGVKSPRLEDNESTFAELRERIAKTIDYLKSVEAAQFENSEERTVNLNFGAFKPSFPGTDYLLGFALPNFYFHVTTAYDILRHNGLKIGKLDYLGMRP